MIKLSQLTTDEFLDKTCDLVPHIMEMIQDEELIKLVTEKVERPEGATDEEVKDLVWEVGVKKINKAVPTIFKTHRNAVYGILATMTNKSIDEVMKQNPFVTIKDIRFLIMDEDLKQLFLELLA